MAETFRVLAVCTGNICRSPAVERLLAAALGPESGVEVTSAGVRALVGHPVPAPMAAHITDAGALVDGFAGRQLTETMAREADLVLAMTREHRSLVVGLAPVVLRRTFTLLELARLASQIDAHRLPVGLPAERLRALLPLAAAQRRMRPGRPEDDDVVDPYGGNDALYARSFAQIRPAVDLLAGLVRP